MGYVLNGIRRTAGYLFSRPAVTLYCSPIGRNRGPLEFPREFAEAVTRIHEEKSLTREERRFISMFESANR